MNSLSEIQAECSEHICRWVGTAHDPTFHSAAVVNEDAWSLSLDKHGTQDWKIRFSADTVLDAATAQAAAAALAELAAVASFENSRHGAFAPQSVGR